MKYWLANAGQWYIPEDIHRWDSWKLSSSPRFQAIWKYLKIKLIGLESKLTKERKKVTTKLQIENEFYFEKKSDFVHKKWRAVNPTIWEEVIEFVCGTGTGTLYEKWKRRGIGPLFRVVRVDAWWLSLVSIAVRRHFSTVVEVAVIVLTAITMRAEPESWNFLCSFGRQSNKIDAFIAVEFRYDERIIPFVFGEPKRNGNAVAHKMQSCVWAILAGLNDDRRNVCCWRVKSIVGAPEDFGIFEWNSFWLSCDEGDAASYMYMLSQHTQTIQHLQNLQNCKQSRKNNETSTLRATQGAIYELHVNYNGRF